MKVFVHGDPAILKDPVLGFPFAFMEGIVPCSDPEEANVIFAPLPSVDTDRYAHAVMQSPEFDVWGEKYVFFTICDSPTFAYTDARGLKLLASPIYPPAVNCAMNVVHVPLWLGQPAWDIQQDTEFIAELREAPKTLNFIFLGDMRTIGERDRTWLARVWERGMKVEHRDPCIWTPGFGEKMREFLREIARARYCFAPRGLGSSSARLYEAMLAGSVPIVDNDLDMPLWRGVDSCEGVVHAPEKAAFPYYDLPVVGKRYWQKREAAMHYWDRFCYLPNCAMAIQEQCFT